MNRPGVLTTTDNHKIHYDHYKKDHPSVLIVAPGFFNSKQAVLLKDLAESLSRSHDVIAFDFRGHGKSSGLFYWTSKEHRDLTAVLAYAKKTYTQIGVIGFSLGAAISLITASKTDVIDSLVCISPPSAFDTIDYRFWELDPENDLVYTFLREGRTGKGVRPGPFWYKKEKPIDCIEKIKAPILFIHGDKDWIIGPWHSALLSQKTKSPQSRVIIKDGHHAEYLLRKNKKTIIQTLLDWFEKTLTG